MPSPTILTAAAITMALATAPSALARESGHEKGLGPGCANNRPAIAHHGGGGVVTTTEEKAPIPCTTATGWRTSEPSIVLTNLGGILLQPAFDKAGQAMGLIRSLDLGTTWEFVPHAAGGVAVTDAIDQNLWVDRETGRAFWIAIDLPSPTPARLDRSDDGGKTWFASGPPCPNRAFGPLGCGHPQVFSGPPTKSLRFQQHDYPNVVYICGGGANPLACQRSVDGGATFGPAVRIPTPPGVACVGFTNFGLNGVVDREGTVYVPFTPCQRPYIAISTDEGATWQVTLVADTLTLGFGMLALDKDKENNLYAGWVGFGDRLPYISVSRDRAAHWSAPVMVGAPGVKEAAIPGLVAGKRGQVAMTYYGSTNPPGPPFPPACNGLSTSCPGYEKQTWNTYVTESWNALDRRPLFWSASLNDPAQSTWYGCSPSELGIPTAPGSTICTARAGNGPTLAGRLDYYGMTMAPDGTPWVGFSQECPGGLPVSGNPNCPSTLTGGSTDGLFGLVGRLVRTGEEEDDEGD